MIDYDATLQKFFDEVIKWLEKTRLQAKDKQRLAQIEKTIAAVRTVAADPKRFADRKALSTDVSVFNTWAFLDGHVDSAVYRAYDRVLWSLSDLYGNFDYPREQAQQMLLGFLKQVKYKNSSNIFKDFTYNFISPSHYAVKVDLQKQK